MTAPPHVFPLVLQPIISPSLRVTSESSARSKQESRALLISKSLIVNTALSGTVLERSTNVTESDVVHCKAIYVGRTTGAAPCSLPAAIAASEVFAKSSYDRVCLSSVDVPQAAVKASPFHVAPSWPSNRTGSSSVPSAVN